MRHPKNRGPRLLASLLVTTSLAACGTTATPAEPAPTATPHGYVPGATEAAEPRPRLVVADSGSGEVRVLDLLTEDVVELGKVEPPRAVHTDGRFAYLATSSGVHVVDGGAWTVDHGEHRHYYHADPAMVGAARIGPVDDVHGADWGTALSGPDGPTAVLDRAVLDDGTVPEPASFEAGPGVPVGDGLVFVVDDSVEVRDLDGKLLAEPETRCTDPGDATAVESEVAMISCADGAVIVSEEDGKYRAEHVPYPENATEAAGEFAHRRGSTVLAAPTGESGVWVLDTAESVWSLLDTGPTVATTAVGADGPVLALDPEGVLRAFDAETGEELAETSLFEDAIEQDTPPVIEVDAERAYVNEAATRTVYEIDYRDGLRVARTFELDVAPTHLVETGR